MIAGTYSEVRDALAFVPAADRELWLRIGMAVKSEFSDDGFGLWSEWSQSDESYNERDAKAVWRSIKPAGGVTIKTLYREAVNRGWKQGMRNGNGYGNGHASQPAAGSQVLRIDPAADEAAAARAAELWRLAEAAPADHPYLMRKQVKPHGLRVQKDRIMIGGVDCDGALIVPARDAAGEIHSVEFITADGTKRYLPSGRIAGCYFGIGKPDSVLLIAEGLATAASLHQATRYATACAFNAGNLLPVAKALRSKYPDIRIVLAADNDSEGATNVGVENAHTAARAVSGLLAIPEMDGRKCDFNDVAIALGVEAVRQAIADAQDSHGSHPASAFTSEPEPLRRPLPAAQPYPLQALGEILGAAAQRIRDVLGVPAAMAGQSILAAASLAVQAHADVEIDGRRETLSLWGLCIGVSGERKSACDHLALRTHREFERAALETYSREKASYDIEMTAYENATKAATKSKDPEALHHELTKLGKAPEAPLKPLLLVGAPTVEAIHKQLIDGLPNIGLFHDDAGEFLGGYSMSQDHRVKTAASLSRIWDVGEFDRIRAADGGSKYYGKRLALYLMLQPVIAETVLSDDLLTGQGFLARCLLSWPTSTIGGRAYVETDLTSDQVMRRYWGCIHQLLTTAPVMRPDTRNELEPRALVLTAEAKIRWIDIHNAIETDMADGGGLSGVRAWASKAPAQVLRIAGVLALIERPNAGVIDLELINRAATLLDHHLGEAIRIVGVNSVPRPIRDAESLLAWCHEGKVRHLFSAMALQNGPGAIRSKASFDAAMGELERCGWAAVIGGGLLIDGKHRRRAWLMREPS